MIEKKLDLSKYDPRKLGLRVGIELHQQLDTRHKLFCSCPTSLAEEEGDIFERRLRPARSELGEVDVAALFEWRRGRVFEYHAPRKASCLVEADEEPPHEINEEAVIIGLAVAMALNSTIVDEIHVMRKIVIDGSNTTGFQRTAIIALGGYIDVNGKRVGIQSIAVEEDAARKLAETSSRAIYKLDRLGIPLLEISTDPDITTPEEAFEVALAIGQLLRLTGKVKRGLGTIRQDLNVSIRDGVRTEIKGVQRLELLPKIVFYEAVRQARLLEIRDELRRRGLDYKLVIEKAMIKDVTHVFKNTKSKIIRRSLSAGGKVLAALLPGFHGLLGVEIQPGRRFGTELADYARFWGGVGGIFHSDELPAYGISEKELDKVYEELGARRGVDAIVLVADREDNARAALEAVIERAAYATIGVPKETRAAVEDGTTRYMRPQPGAARMYPETDIPPLEVTKELLERARLLVPEKPSEKLKKLVEVYGLSRDLAQQLLRSLYLDLFERLASRYANRVQPTIIARIIVSTLKALQREGLPVSELSDSDIEGVVQALAEGRMAKEAVEDVLRYLVQHPGSTVDEAIKALGIRTVDVHFVEELVDEAVRALRDEIKEKGMAALNKVMGRVMSKLRGKVDGRLVAEIARRKIAEFLSKQ
ncbi:MAG: Glu-tRNA(Gln) amidotransferase subunit GatE [Pyrodictiaceae archaeon]